MAHVEGGERLRRWARDYGRGGNWSIKVGFFKTAQYQASQGKPAMPVAMVAAWNEFGTQGRTRSTPERPFFRNAIRSRSNHKKIVQTIARNTNAKTGKMGKRGRGQVGRQMVSSIQESIKSLQTPPNSPMTIAIKGSSNPLIDTGHMRRSVSHEDETNAD